MGRNRLRNRNKTLPQRLVVVSNRVTPITGKQAATAGGLAVGVHSALNESGGLWLGWSGETTSDAPGETRVFTTGKVTYALVDLRVSDLDAYYGGFSNRTLWPLLHYRLDLATFDHQWYATYRRVNRLFAERLQPLLEEGDEIWIQDYHLIPMATELRRLGITSRIGFFLHIPWPPAELVVTLPWHRQLASDICAYDVVGFQTPVDVRHFRQYVISELQGTMTDEGAVRALGRSFHTEAIPIGIDVDSFGAMAGSRDAANQAKRVSHTLQDRDLIIGVDRLLAVLECPWCSRAG
ncbi:MAG: trehalose-6-phosphate synthase, partial [Pseudomonadota bacterium]